MILFEKEKWEVIEHSWSDTSIYNQDNETICTLSISDLATEENQEDLEKLVSERFELIRHSPDMFNLMIKMIKENMLSSHGDELANELIDKITKQ